MVYEVPLPEEDEVRYTAPKNTDELAEKFIHEFIKLSYDEQKELLLSFNSKIKFYREKQLKILKKEIEEKEKQIKLLSEQNIRQNGRHPPAF